MMIGTLDGPWAIDRTHPAAFQIIDSWPPDKSAIIHESALPASDSDRQLGIEDGIANVKIEGVLLKSVPSWLRSLATSYQDIAAAVNAAAMHNDIEQIRLVVDSPGGEVAGVTLAVDAVWRARKHKPVIAEVHGTAAGAAYWIASQASRILADVNSEIGGIGVYETMIDYSKRDRKAGMKVIVIRSGPHKAAGIDGVTDEQIAGWQEIISAQAENFVRDVRRGRGMKSKQWSSGRTWIAKEARQLGLIDEVV